MRNKVWLIIAASLILVGALIFVGVMSMLKWDFKKLSTAQFQTMEHEITTDFKDISISARTTKITFIPSTDGKVHITSYEDKTEPMRAAVENDTLTIKQENHKKWYQYIGFGFVSPKLTVALPQGSYGTLTIDTRTSDMEISTELSFANMDITASTGDIHSSATVTGNVKIKTSTGDIHVENINGETLSLSVTTGHITLQNTSCTGELNISVTTGDNQLTNVRCGSLTSTGSTGDMNLQDVIATGSFNINRETGDVRFTNCDAAEITVTTDTGDVSGTLLTGKVFITSTDTGKIRIPESTTGGKCKITTDTGDIIISFAE